MKSLRISCQLFLYHTSLNRLFTEIRSGGRPIFRIFHEISGNQSCVGICAGEDPYHTRTAADLPVQPFQHVGGRDLSCIQLREGIKTPGNPPSRLPGNGWLWGKRRSYCRQISSASLTSLLSGWGQPDGLEILGKGIFVLVRNMRQNITHEMYLAPLPTCARKAFADRRNKSGVCIGNNQSGVYKVLVPAIREKAEDRILPTLPTWALSPEYLAGHVHLYHRPQTPPCLQFCRPYELFRTGRPPTKWDTCFGKESGCGKCFTCSFSPFVISLT